ncbi:MAG: hypothetical protein AB1390_09305 [Nitrospirota bacterium]
MIPENQNQYNGKVVIDGKTYQTVAYRMAEFRKKYPVDTGWTIGTKCLCDDGQKVTFKATIKNPEGKAVATGHAQERWGSTEINETSAYENCETSAIGRALAMAGFIGTEFASADEVALAIAAQGRQENRAEETGPEPNQEALPKQAEPFRAEAKPHSQEAKQSAEPQNQAKPDEAQSQETEQAEQNRETSQPDEERAERWARENLEEWLDAPCPFEKAGGRTWRELAQNKGDKIAMKGKATAPRAYLHALESWADCNVWPRMKARIALEVGKNGNGTH